LKIEETKLALANFGLVICCSDIYKHSV